jgi:hypothetical protein
MITETKVHNMIEGTKKIIRRHFEIGRFDLTMPVLTWYLLKELEDKLKSGSFEEKKEEKNFEILEGLYKISYDYSLPYPPNKPDSDFLEMRLEDMEVTFEDDCYMFDETRALLKKYILEDKRQQAFELTWLVRKEEFDKINSLYQEEFGK